MPQRRARKPAGRPAASKAMPASYLLAGTGIVGRQKFWKDFPMPFHRSKRKWDGDALA
jgi:hypothetical protein